MNNCFVKIFSFLLMGFMILNFHSQAEATIVKGYAAILNDDVNGARETAKKQAMRELIEQVIGVRTQSTVEVSMNMLVRDEILTKSDGYVTINKIIKEEIQGDIFYIEMDVTASTERIKSTSTDLKSRLDYNVNDSDMRGGIVTAIILKENGVYSYEPAFGRFIVDKLELTGLRASSNDKIIEYLINNHNDPNMELHARALARDSEERWSGKPANAFLRGMLSVESVRSTVDKKYEAVVRASFELIGFETNDIDIVDKYFKVVANTREEAIRQAKENATFEAMDSLAKQALETVQTVAQDDIGAFETTLVFEQLTDISIQLPMIENALKKLNCNIIRSNIPNDSKVIYLISTMSYRDSGSLTTAILKEMPEFTPTSAGLGISKIKLLFKG